MDASDTVAPSMNDVNSRAASGSLHFPRLVGGVLLLVLGPLLLFNGELLDVVLFDPTQANPLLLLSGYLVFAAGWLVLPGRWRRRGIGAGVGVASLLLLANTLLTYHPFGLVGGLFGPMFLTAIVWLFKSLAVAGVVAAWFIARSRPVQSYAVLPATFLAYALLYVVTPGSPQSVIIGALENLLDPIFGTWLLPGVRSLTVSAVLVAALLIIGSAWLGRFLDSPAVTEALAARMAKRKKASARRIETLNRDAERAELTRRAEELKRWEDAYAATHDGQRPPAGFTPPVSISPQGGTNTLAILALIFGLMGGWLGIVFGHLARSQIRQTGQQGWTLATIGMVFGYTSLVLVGIVLVGFTIAVVTNIR